MNYGMEDRNLRKLAAKLLKWAGFRGTRVASGGKEEKHFINNSSPKTHENSKKKKKNCEQAEL